MRKNKTTVNTASKDVLAKAMAMEGISVQHDNTAETAWFNVQTRTLCLPVWEDMTNDVYDMLVGHEVSHALHTPCDAWSSWIGKDQLSGMRHQFLNVVEDARIERLIKDKFPGLKRNFARAYKQFSDNDMFEINGKNISDLPILDRLNIEFKLGMYGHADVEFSADEQQFVDRMGQTKTIEDVQNLAQDLFELWLDELPEDEQQPQPEMGEGGEEQSDEGQQSPADAEGQDDNSESGADSEGEGGGNSTEDSGDDESQQDGESNTGDDEDSGESMNDNTDDGESADSKQGNESSDGGSEPNSLEYDDYSNDPCGSTQRSFDKAIQGLRNEKAKSHSYHTIPKMNVENIVVGYKDILEQFNEFNTDNSDRISQSNDQLNCLNECDEFLRKSRPIVNHMVQQFMMKQAADVAKKTHVTKTGVLDTVSMINYRWSEDIFVKNETHEDGKSHGIVMFLDWSGSMSDILNDTIEQLLVLTEFCNKMQIPFEVYAFTSSYDRGSDKPQFQFVNNDNDKMSLRPHRFNLLNFLSSRMNKQEYKQSIKNLWLLGEGNRWNRNYYILTPSKFGLGCTPLNEAVITALEIIPEFQRENGVQIVNSVFLTDGDGHPMGASYGYGKNFIVEPNTRRNIEINNNNNSHAGETAAYLQVLKNQTGCNIIGIRLSSARNVDYFRYRYLNNDEESIRTAAKSYKTNNFIGLKDCEGHDELFIIKGNTKVMTDVLGDLNSDSSLAKVRNAFVKGNSKKKSSRVIASRIVDLIAQ